MIKYLDMELNIRNSEKFLIIYNELDKFMRTQLGANDEESHTTLIVKMAKNNLLFRKNQDDLKGYAKLRNAIVHNPYKEHIEPIAEPHEYIIEKYNAIKDQVLSPPLALYSIAIKADKIFTARLSDKAMDVMKKMNEYTFTHVPIIKDNILVGVFSENTIFSYIVRNGEAIFENDYAISEFADLIPIDAHENECFLFKSRNTVVAEIEEVFHTGLKDKKRIAVIFITENGKCSEKILGMITAWDIAGYTA